MRAVGALTVRERSRASAAPRSRGSSRVFASEKIFSNPDKKATEDYLSGRFG